MEIILLVLLGVLSNCLLVAVLKNSSTKSKLIEAHKAELDKMFHESFDSGYQYGMTEGHKNGRLEGMRYMKDQLQK
jgi:flagellar biosynthesis/type III secretory pathway protein FliH